MIVTKTYVHHAYGGRIESYREDTLLFGFILLHRKEIKA